MFLLISRKYFLKCVLNYFIRGNQVRKFLFGVADETVPMGTRLMILSGAYRLRYIAKRADVSRNCMQRNEWKKENASGKQVREFAIRRPTRRITQDTAFGGM